MFLIKWYREWRQVRSDFYQPPICASCEAMKETIGQLQYQNTQLISALTRTPAPERRVDTSNLKPIMPTAIPWKQRRQMLEAEDRHNAQLLKKKREEMEQTQTPIATVAGTTLEELEREVGVVDEDAGQEERQSNTA